MKNTILIAFTTAVLVASGAAVAAPAERATAPAETQIPFVNHGGVRDWRAAGTHALYVQDNHRKWYRAELMGPCSGLPFTEAIGFETRGPDTLDRFGTLIVRGQRCPLTSLVASAPPPGKARAKTLRAKQG